MAKTNKERVLDYLWSVTPEGATNAQIREAMGIASHQSVYMLTQELKRQGQHLPSAKFATIAEHVWLLEKTGAPQSFLVFGNDPEVPRRWLDRYGGLVNAVAFYFVDDDGALTVLAGADDA